MQTASLMHARIFRLSIFCLGPLAVVACTPLGVRPGIERADDLGLQTAPTDVQPLPPLPPLPPLSAPDATSKLYRDGFVEQWMARSDLLCRQYKDKIILLSRNSRFAADATSTILSGLATVFTAIGTIHPLTGAATIVSGVGAAAQNDTFEQQSGEIIATAIQTARENQANQIEANLKLSPVEYNIYRAQRDIIDYHNMCSLETALTQVRSSLKASSPNEGQTPPAAQGVEPVKPSITIVPAGGVGEQQTAPTDGAGTSQVSATGPATPNIGPPPNDRIAAAEGDERKIPAAWGRDIQTALCLSPDVGTVTFGPKTRAAITLFRATPNGKQLSSAGGTKPAPQGLSRDEISFLRTQKCDAICYRNAYEFYQFGSARELNSLINRLLKAMPNAAHPTASKLCDPNVRNLISETQRIMNVPSDGTLTPKFVDSLPPEF